MLCPKSALKESQCTRKRLFAFLNFDKKPRFFVPCDKKIHFSFLPITQIEKTKLAKP